MVRPIKARSFTSRSSRYVASPTLVPPKVSELGHQAFTSVEHASLARWLQESTWPRGTLDIHGLEGYLAALLVWPVELQPGAWLPPIWNQGGWKIPPPIETTQRFQDFLELVLGYLRAIDNRLLNDPLTFEVRLRPPPAVADPPSVLQDVQSWAQGFGRGLQQAAQGRDVPDLDAREAVRSIAANAAGQSRVAQRDARHAYRELTKAVLVLAKKRRSRGPLGSFPEQSGAAKETDSRPTKHLVVQPK